MNYCMSACSEMSPLFSAMVKCGAATDYNESATLIRSLLASLEQTPPQVNPTQTVSGENRVDDVEFNAADTPSLLGFAAFKKALLLDGVEGASNKVAAIFAMLGLQAHVLAANLGLPHADADILEEVKKRNEGVQQIPRETLLNRRQEYLYLLNALERRYNLVRLRNGSNIWVIFPPPPVWIYS